MVNSPGASHCAGVETKIKLQIFWALNSAYLNNFVLQCGEFFKEKKPCRQQHQFYTNCAQKRKKKCSVEESIYSIIIRIEK